MKSGYFARLAVTGMKNNRRFYLPYFLACVGMVMMQYIITSLPDSPAMKTMKGAESLSMFLTLGSLIIAIFAALFLFYTHSFLMRRRKKEFGLYSILGMGKLGIGRILAWETLLVGVSALVLGTFGGAVFAKMAELIVTHIMVSQVTYDLVFSFKAFATTAIVFGVIFLLILIWSILQVQVSSAIALLKSENTGEKAPRANWLFGTFGFLVLAGAYAIAIATDNPMSAMVLFFIAVVMVILATYIIMISGSVMLCKLLQKKKSYYYDRRHFVAVSSMSFRMKRNGAGLASICVLSTMVLVMMVSSVSLYAGMNSALDVRYPRENCVYTRLDVSEIGNHTDTQFIRDVIDGVVKENGVTPENEISYRNFYTFGRINGDTFDLLDMTDSSLWSSAMDISNLSAVNVVPLTDLNACFAADYTLNPGEALMYLYKTSHEASTFRFGDLVEYNIVGEIQENWPFYGSLMEIVPNSITLFVPDFDESLLPLRDYAEKTESAAFYYLYVHHFDCAENLKQPLHYAFMNTFLHGHGFEGIVKGFNVENRSEALMDYLSVYGGLLFLGILLSIIFLSATVLIIYYKQVTEGFEDQSRFEIMQNVGMTKKDIRTSVNAQIRLVFFLPLGLSLMHTAFAIPLLSRMFMVFGFVNLQLILLTAAVSVLVFSLFYFVVYRITAGAYFSIVSDAK